MCVWHGVSEILISLPCLAFILVTYYAVCIIVYIVLLTLAHMRSDGFCLVCLSVTTLASKGITRFYAKKEIQINNVLYRQLFLVLSS